MMLLLLKLLRSRCTLTPEGELIGQTHTQVLCPCSSVCLAGKGLRGACVFMCVCAHAHWWLCVCMQACMHAQHVLIRIHMTLAWRPCKLYSGHLSTFFCLQCCTCSPPPLLLHPLHPPACCAGHAPSLKLPPAPLPRYNSRQPPPHPPSPSLLPPPQTYKRLWTPSPPRRDPPPYPIPPPNFLYPQLKPTHRQTQNSKSAAQTAPRKR